MKTSVRLTAAAATLLLVAGWAVAAAPAVTIITIPDMDCAGCAKKVAAQLVKVGGVEKAVADVEAKTMTITPKKDTVLSPKALWEAVEKGAKTPSKLEGPSGTFTKKPND